MKAATDATTDRVYIPGGAPENGMLVYDPSSKALSAITMPPGGTTASWNMYTFAWNDVRQSLLYLGGYDTPGPSYFYEYAPAGAALWTALVCKNKEHLLFYAVVTFFVNLRNALRSSLAHSQSSFFPQGSSGSVPPLLVDSCMISGKKKYIHTPHFFSFFNWHITSMMERTTNLIAFLFNGRLC